MSRHRVPAYPRRACPLADRLTLAGPTIYGAEIDKYCVYPIVNAKTGGRMHTVASWSIEVMRTPSLQESHGRVEGRVVVEILATDGEAQVQSNCQAFTQLGQS